MFVVQSDVSTSKAAILFDEHVLQLLRIVEFRFSTL